MFDRTGKLRKARETRNLTLDELSLKTAIPKNLLDAAENGYLKTTGFAYCSLRIWANSLDVSIEFLVRD